MHPHDPNRQSRPANNRADQLAVSRPAPAVRLTLVVTLAIPAAMFLLTHPLGALAVVLLIAVAKAR